MKKMGIIGGAGPLASALFYETLVHGYYQKGKLLPEIVLINFPFTRGLTVEEGNAHGKILMEELAYCIALLEQHRVEAGVVVCNTLHLYLNQLPKSSFAVYSLPELVLREANERGFKRLLLLGTQNTCRSDLYQDPDIALFYPSVEGQNTVDDVINRVLEGQLLRGDAEALGCLIYELSAELDLDGVILGCSDLPVLHHRFPIPSIKPLLDSIKIPVGYL
jgi:aspartate racemase